MIIRRIGSDFGTFAYNGDLCLRSGHYMINLRTMNLIRYTDSLFSSYSNKWQEINITGEG